MRLAKFWGRDSAEVDDVSVTARGWSDESMDAARAKAREIARHVADRVLNHPGVKEKYPYGDRPLPEPVLKTFPAGTAVITRNLYGAEILNTDEMMFVDIDRDDPRPRKVDVESVAAKHGLSGRVYETYAGYRVILTNRKFMPGSPEAEALMHEFGADQMYVRLCKMQISFRARLTPKPWRCDWYNPRGSGYPIEDSWLQELFDQWVREYNEHASRYATCQLVGTFGSEVLPEFSELIAYHDVVSKSGSGLPLA